MATIKGEDTRRRRPPAGKRAEEAAPSGSASTGNPENGPSSSTQAPPDGQAGTGLPTPEAALGLWMSWMKQNMGGFAPTGSTEQPWWVASADAVSGSLLATGVEQFQRFVAADPMLA